MTGKHLRRNCHSLFNPPLVDSISKVKQIGCSTERDNAPCTTTAQLASRVGHPVWEMQADERMRYHDFYSVASDAALSCAHIVGKCVGINGLLGFCAKAKWLWRTLNPSQAAPHDLPLSPVYSQSTPSDNFSSPSERTARSPWPQEGCVC